MKLFLSAATLSLCAVVSLPAFAKPKPKTKTYPVSCSILWPVTKAAVKDHYDVLNLDDQTHAGSFTTGSVFTGIRPLAFHLDGSGDSRTVYVTGHYSGLIHNDKGDLFKRIREGLDGTQASASAKR